MDLLAENLRRQIDIQMIQINNIKGSGPDGNIFEGHTNMRTLRDSLVGSNERRKRYTLSLVNKSLKNTSGNNVDSSDQEYQIQPSDIDKSLEIDPNDTKVVEQVLRESLIKSFMVIFTHEHS